MRLPAGYRKYHLLRARLAELEQAGQLKENGIAIYEKKKSYTTYQSIKIIGGSPLLFKVSKADNASKKTILGRSSDLQDRTFIQQGDPFVAHIWASQFDQVLIEDGLNEFAASIKASPLSRDEFGTYSFCKLIGLNPDRARYVLDFVFQTKLPGLMTMVMDRKFAEDLVVGGGQLAHPIGGLYYLYRLEQNEALLASMFNGTKDVITRATISVRYPLPHRTMQPSHKSNRHEELERIRVKAIIPRYPSISVGKLNFSKYDGYVAPTRDNPGRLQWLMEMRQSHKSSHDNVSLDAMMMYSNLPTQHDFTDYYCASVDLLTQDQSPNRNPLYSKAVLLKSPHYSVTEHKPAWENPRTPSIYEGGYYYVQDKNRNPVGERGFMRSQYGFILNQKTFIDYTGKPENMLEEHDHIAIKLLENL